MRNITKLFILLSAGFLLSFHIVEAEKMDDEKIETEETDVISDIDDDSYPESTSLNVIAVSDADLKSKLNELGFQQSNSLEEALRDFQSYYGLKTTGMADENTLELLDELENWPYRRGAPLSQNNIDLQRKLMHYGFGNFNVSRNYGPTTERTVKAFQDYYGLVVNGIADPVTLAKLDELEALPLQPGNQSQE